MINEIITLTASDYPAGFLTQLLLSVFGDFHINTSYVLESNTNSISNLVKVIDFPWIISALFVIVLVYCVYRVISTIISRF